jgi:hypothetical protein
MHAASGTLATRHNGDVGFVAEDLLKRHSRTCRFNETSLLGAFDLNRDVVEAAAIKVYALAHKDGYDLLMVDF